MHDFVDSSFSKENSHQYSLSIQVSLNGFSFCVRGGNGKLLAFKPISVKISSEQLLTRRLEDWFNEEEFLQLSYRAKQVLFSGSKFSLVPQQLESDEVKATVQKLILKPDEETEHAENWVEALQAKLIFLLPDNLLLLLRDKLGDFKMGHILQPLIQQLFADAPGNQITLFFDEKDMYLLLKKDNRLMLCNVFRINHPNDALYYVLTAIRQHNLNTKNMAVQLTGRSQHLDALQQSFSDHFKETRTVNTPQTNDGLEPRIIPEFVCLW